MAPFLAMAVLAVCSLPGRADELEKLLRRPPSPGSLALLAAHLGQDGVAEKLTLGLASPDADTRGTAARLVNLGGERALLPAVQEALNSEKDPAAAQEEIRTLAALGGSSFDAALLAAGRRFSPTLDGHLARILGRIRGPAAFALYFSGLRDLALSDADRKDFFRMATRGTRPSFPRPVASRSSGWSGARLRRSTSWAWRRFLAGAMRRRHSTDAPFESGSR
ncbi:MAG: hypothetical protein WEB59_08525 [Thermoanaerobaculia bacterium]